MRPKTIYFLLLFSFVSSAVLPATPTDKFYKGLKLFNAGKYAASETLLVEFMNEQPFEYEIRDAIYYLGEINRIRGKWEEAVSYYNKLNSRYPHSRYRTNLYYLYGECYYHMNLISRSVENFTAYIEKSGQVASNPEYFINANFYLAKISEIYRDWNNALKHYHDAILYLDPYIETKKSNRKMQDLLKDQKRDIFYAMGLVYSEKSYNQELAYKYLSGAIDLGQPLTPSLNYLLRRLTILHIGRENGLPDDSISDIVVDGDDVWIATWGGGLVRFARSSGVYSRIPLPSSQIRNIYVDFENVYVSSYDGIFIFDKKSSRSYQLSIDEKVFSLAQKVIKDDRLIYFSTLSEGVIQYDVIKKTVQSLNEQSYISSRMVYSMDANHEYIAFGTVDRGAIIKDKNSGEIHYVNTSNNQLGGDNVKSILIDGRFVWIGVHKLGVYRYDLKTKKTRFFDWGVPYPSSFALRDRKLWVGTSGNGIRIYDREKNKLEKLTVIEGLSSNEIHMIRVEGRYIWVGYLDNGIDVLYKPDLEK